MVKLTQKFLQMGNTKQLQDKKSRLTQTSIQSLPEGKERLIAGTTPRTSQISEREMSILAEAFSVFKS